MLMLVVLGYCPWFWHLCCSIEVSFYTLQIASKFGQRWMVMKNYPRDLSQLETGNCSLQDFV